MARVARQASVPWIGCYKGEQARGDAQLHSAVVCVNKGKDIVCVTSGL
jgi:hypothetical protein